MDMQSCRHDAEVMLGTHLHRAPISCKKERGLIGGAWLMDRGPSRQKGLYHSSMTVQRRQMQCRLILRVKHEHICIVPQQQLHHILMALLSRADQGGISVGIHRICRHASCK